MEKIQTITVKHAGGEYPVFVGAGASSRLPEYLPDGKSAAVSNKAVWGISGNQMHLQIFATDVILINDGEEHKKLQTVEEIINRLAELGMHRNGAVVAFGGGVVGDIAGFAAASYMRGVRLIQVPTTLLAQVDAAVGGKTGVNHKRGKNLIGAFYQPSAVICDTNLLQTLPEREYRAGLAEVVKYGLLGDAEFFAWLEKNAEALMDYKTPGNPAVQEAIVRSVRMKAEIVAEDERETTGRRALLNLGHTFAHAVENAAGYGEWLHGEAVAAGLVAAAKLSEKICGFPAADTKRITKLLDALNLPVSFGQINTPKILNVMQMDKKFTKTNFLGMRFVVMNSVGNAELYDVKDVAKVVDVIREMCDN